MTKLRKHLGLNVHRSLAIHYLTPDLSTAAKIVERYLDDDDDTLKLCNNNEQLLLLLLLVW